MLVHPNLETPLLELHSVGGSPLLNVAGRWMPVDPVVRDSLDDDPGWAAGLLMENGAALVVVADDDGCGRAHRAVVHLVVPTSFLDWRSTLDALPGRVSNGRIHPLRHRSSDRSTVDWVFNAGWWALLDTAHELWTYVRLFGTMPVHQQRLRRDA